MTINVFRTKQHDPSSLEKMSKFKIGNKRNTTVSIKWHPKLEITKLCNVTDELKSQESEAASVVHPWKATAKFPNLDLGTIYDTAKNCHF
jgi:hypothetical protein